MSSNNTYLLELNIQKCKININESGSMGLLLRAGPSQSHVTQLKPLIKGIIDFNTYIKLNIDDSALETQRCSLTLNFVSTSNQKRVVGIVVINIPPLGSEVSKMFKITSTPDKDAEIYISIKVNPLDQSGLQKKNRQSNTGRSSKSSVLMQKSSLTDAVISINQRYPNHSNFNRVEEKPTSPPTQIIQQNQRNHDHQQLKLKSKSSESLPLKIEDLHAIIKNLRRQKECLKQLLKLETNKNKIASAHFENILTFLQSSIGINTNLNAEMVNGNAFSQIDLGEGDKQRKFNSFNHEIRFDSNNFQQKKRLINELSLKNSVNKDKYEAMGLQIKSNLSSSQKSDINEVLNGFMKALQQSNQSKQQICQVLETIKMTPNIEIDISRIKSLKIKIDRTYVNLLNRKKLEKQDILRHKIELNKFLEEFMVPYLNEKK